MLHNTKMQCKVITKLIDTKLSKMTVDEAIVYHVYILHICIYYEMIGDMPLKKKMRGSFLRRLNRKSILLTRQDLDFELFDNM